MGNKPKLDKLLKRGYFEYCTPVVLLVRETALTLTQEANGHSHKEAILKHSATLI